MVGKRILRVKIHFIAELDSTEPVDVFFLQEIKPEDKSIGTFLSFLGKLTIIENSKEIKVVLLDRA